MILMAHPTGNANVRQAALALAENDLLAEFWTAVSWNPASPLGRLLPHGVRQQLERRTLPAAVRGRTHHAPWRELGRMLASQLRWSFPSRHERGPWSIDAVFQSLDRRVARRVACAPEVTGVYAYEDGAAATFAAARARGLRCLYDLPIGYWRAAHAIYAEEAEREPEWACTLSGMRDSPEKLARKDEELALAETVVVASSFTRQTIQAAPRCTAPIHVIPYGAPAPVTAPRNPQASDGQLKVLFAGSLGQRKGLSYLLRAIDLLPGRVTLTLLGARVSTGCAPLEAALRRHRWIPTLPLAEVLREMARHDVLVFPSLFEGFGLVLLEAMAQGLPIVATAHTAAPDLITEGREGFIVPVRSAEAIAEKLDLLAGDSRLLSAMKVAARATADQHSWASYRSQLAHLIRRATQPTPP
jgi:glycosyltransferase involved in cell wall biosynthesis